jgi:hypothetical protein
MRGEIRRFAPQMEEEDRNGRLALWAEALARV